MISTRSVAAALQDVADPELGIDIVDLGLIYRIEAEESRVFVEMSATSDACPMTALIQSAAHTRLEEAFPGAAIEVAMVMEPQWEAGMLGEAARRRLGLGDRRVR